MEIDLERPSYEQKFEARSSISVEITNSADAVPIEKEDLNSRRSSEPLDEDCENNLNGSISSDLVQLDVNAAGGNIVNKEALYEPQNGLEFETKEDAYSFYREYARSVGFGITIKASRRSKKTGKFIDVKIVCSRFGSKRESSTTMNPRPCIKTNCKAGMHMKRTRDGKWAIYSIIKEHNHKICPDDFYHAIRGRSKPPAVVACVKKGLQLALDEGDVPVMLDYFMSMQNESPNFFYAVDFDREKCMRNVFWVDAKGRNDYNNFCDVVFFDTFYVRNKYKVPFAPFVGINHQLQFILLGGALVGEESTLAMVWLMKTWLKAVGGQAPKVIITDQDDFLKEAVLDVFPNTRHCFSLWHVFSKLPDGLSCLKDQHENFIRKFNKCVFQPWTEKLFEDGWWKMVDKFELRDNEWIQSLYEDRKKWVPTYMRGTSLAGMSAIERSGSINSFFDRYMHRDAPFKEFIQQFRKFLLDRYDLEAKADFETENEQPASRSLSAFEKQMSSVYTEAVFKKFQVEILGVVSCHLQKEREDEGTVIFRVDDFAERQNFFVAWNEAELEICCSCHSFEYKGFLCKHAMLVLQMSGVLSIPSHYILKRWSKDAKISRNCSEASGRLHFRAQRFNDLCKLSIKLGEEGSLSQEAYKIACEALEEALRHCVDTNNSVRDVLEPNMSAVHGFYSNPEEKHGNKGSKKSKKRTYKRRQAHTDPEGTTMGLQNSCLQMGQVNSRSHNLDHGYVPQEEMQGMELSNRVQALDGYYGSQQSMQGVGQLNSISPISDGYFGNQLGPQGLGQLHPMPTRVSHYGTQQNLLGLGQVGFRGPTTHGFC